MKARQGKPLSSSCGMANLTCHRKWGAVFFGTIGIGDAGAGRGRGSQVDAA